MSGRPPAPGFHRGQGGESAIAYNAQVDYLYAAIIFVFILAVLLVLWKREHPKKS
jgi:hypothetical protein